MSAFRTIEGARDSAIIACAARILISRLRWRGSASWVRRGLRSAGLALDPSFTIRRYRDIGSTWSDNPTYRTGRERVIEGMRLAGVPEG
jgi:hypothetical protein